MRLALYARVSTRYQRPGPQLDVLREYAKRRGGGALEFVDKGVSGAKDRRPALDRMMEAVRRREVDAVVCVKLDRLARSVRHLTEMAAELEACGVALVVIDQAIDTSTPAGRLLFNVLGSIAEFERDLIRERVTAGLAAAKRRGQTLGRPKALDARGAARVRRLRDSGHSLRAIAAKVGVGLGTVQRVLAG
jgi:DNA invertase Pin-like site-specific DNA recombinase